MMTFRVDICTVNGDILKSFLWETDRYDDQAQAVGLDQWWNMDGQFPIGPGVPLGVSVRRIL